MLCGLNLIPKSSLPIQSFHAHLSRRSTIISNVTSLWHAVADSDAWDVSTKQQDATGSKLYSKTQQSWDTWRFLKNTVTHAKCAISIIYIHISTYIYNICNHKSSHGHYILNRNSTAKWLTGPVGNVSWTRLNKCACAGSSRLVTWVVLPGSRRLWQLESVFSTPASNEYNGTIYMPNRWLKLLGLPRRATWNDGPKSVPQVSNGRQIPKNEQISNHLLK